MTKERVKKIRSSMNKLLYEKKVVSVVDIFQDIDMLSKKDYEDIENEAKNNPDNQVLDLFQFFFFGRVL